MAPSRAPSSHLLRSLRNLDINGTSMKTSRALTTSCRYAQEQVQKESFFQNPNPETVFVPRLERRLAAAGNAPVGSRRRRMALAHSHGLPFDQLPYQCFQEARKILIADRAEKLQKIELIRSRIARILKSEPADAREEQYKQKRLKSMRDELEHLKILADSNDPNVKRRFEDGKGDMAKPIYRFLADRKWREYKRKIMVQRITQMNVVPDVVPVCDPILDLDIIYNNKIVQPGTFIQSSITEQPFQLKAQSFEKASKMVTIAVVDPDVPNLDTDRFDSRCHFLATNIEISPLSPKIDLNALSEAQILLPWLPPTAQKGAPYHRLSIIVLQHKDDIPMDREVALKHITRDNFSTRAMMTRHILKPISATMFRTKWDDTMADVMNRHGVPGADQELKKNKVEPLPYKRRNPSTFR